MPDAFEALRHGYEALVAALALPAPDAQRHRELRTRRTDNGEAHVESVDGRWHYVVTERGAELHRRIAADADELLYWLLDDVTAAVAQRRPAPLLARLRKRDSRRHRFATQLALLRRVRPAWAQRKRAYFEDLLQRYPFRDGGANALP